LIPNPCERSARVTRTVVGWDIGGAHLKAARLDAGRLAGVAQEPTPLWRGLDTLERGFDAMAAFYGEADLHAVTMTGELCDAFASRREGVAGLAAIAARRLKGPVVVYAGRAGFLAPGEAGARADDVASANWLATTTLLARRLRDAVLIDIGSTTADIAPIAEGRVATVGYTDAERLRAGELVYTGVARSFVMALTDRAPFAGAWTPLMNEYFASSADVHRALGDLPDGADRMETADGRDKSEAASRARLARMIGLEADDAAPQAWRSLAAWFAETQLRAVCDAAFLRLSRGDVREDAPVVAAGVGAGMAGEVARRLGRDCLAFEAALGLPDAAGACAPAVAVASLAAQDIDPSRLAPAE
jgi:probable H4MPT-linked C1 transfer pathway protein